LDGNHVFALFSCIAPFHLPSPQMGSARVAFVLSSLEERNFTEVGTFQPSLGFKDFHQAARLHPLAGVTQDGDHQFDGGEKRAGLQPPPLPQLQGCSSSVLGRGVRRVGVHLRAGSGPLLPSLIGGKGVRRSWRWQLPRVWLSGLSGFGAASGATSHRGSRKRFLRR
jgi:hypothetical protein